MPSFATPGKRSLGAPSSSPSSSGLNSSATIRVFLADDHPAIRSALRGTIEEETGMDVCGEASSSGEALRQIEGLAPDVAIVDISLEDAHGLGLVDSLQAFASETQVLVYSMYKEEVYATRAAKAGASGYLEKSEPPEKITEAIQAVAQGEVYLSQNMSSKLLKRVTGRAPSDPNRPEEVLSDRELEVFQMLGLGFSRTEIQERLCLSRKTVDAHRRGAKKKLGCESMGKLYREAVGWILGHASGRSGEKQTSEHSEAERRPAGANL